MSLSYLLLVLHTLRAKTEEEERRRRQPRWPEGRSFDLDLRSHIPELAAVVAFTVILAASVVGGDGVGCVDS